MKTPFVGSEALSAGRLSRHALRTRFEAVHPDVYVARGETPTATSRAVAAWLWSGRTAVVAGRSAAALHGAKWVDDRAPAQLLHSNRRPARGIETWSDRCDPHEVVRMGAVRVTTPARTVLDLARRLPIEDAVVAIDALARATKLDMTQVEPLVARHRGRRGMQRARVALDLVDAGAESPQETRLRLTYVRAGFPRPETQIAVRDEYGRVVAVLDMGWRDVMVAADYEGDHHRTNRRQFNNDIRRHDTVTQLGWDDMRITVEDPEAVIVARARAAFERRGLAIDAWAGRRFPGDPWPNVRPGREIA